MNIIKAYLSIYFGQDSLGKYSQFPRHRAFPRGLDYDIFQATHTLIYDPAIVTTPDWKKL